MRLSTRFKKTRFSLLLFLLLFCSAFSFKAMAQASQAASDGNFMSQRTQRTQNEAAAEKEDENAVYKKSASVRMVGRLLHLSPEHAAVVFEDFNFLILAGIALFYAVKLLPKFFAERQSKLDKQLMIARMAAEEASERLLEVEERLGRLDQEIKELRGRSEQEGAKDEERIKAAIEEERKKIVAATEHEVAAIALMAERSLSRFAADLAVDRAAARLTLTEDDDRAIVRDFNPGADASLQERRN